MKGKKLKKLISLLLALIMLLTVVPATVSAAAAEEVTVLTAKISEAVETNGKNLFASASEAVQKAGEKLKSVMNLSSNSDFEYKVLEDGTAEITGYKGKATDVVIPSEIDGYKVTSLGDYAFYGDSIIKSVAISDGVTSIGGSAFDDCKFLTDITVSLRNAVYSDLNGVLFNKDKSEIVRYPQGKKNESYVIPNSVISIGNNAFKYAELINLIIPNSVNNIGKNAFYHCTKFINITVPDSVLDIGESAFEGCYNLEYVELPRNISTIADRLFYNSGICSIKIPEGVKRIGGSAFQNCYFLEEIVFPNGVTSVGPESVKGSAYYYNDKNWSDDGLLYVNNIIVSVKSEVKENILIKEGTTVISDYLFAYNEAIKNVNIPKSVLYIGDGAFYISSVESVVNAKGVISLGKEVFFGSKNLKNVEIPVLITEIPDSTFYNCYSLTNITIPSNIKYIGSSAFFNCTSLKNVVIPNSVLSIADYVFSGCSNLESVQLSDNITSIQFGMFEECSSLSNITIPAGVTSIGDYAFSNCSSLVKIIIPEKVKYIGKSSFVQCTSLEELTINDGVATIGKQAFAFCDSLRNVSFPKGITRIDNETFMSCKSLTDIVIPEGVVSIGERAFYMCTSISRIRFPKSLKNVGPGAFGLQSWSDPPSSEIPLKYVYYNGTKQQWDDIYFDPSNITLTKRMVLDCAIDAYDRFLKKGSVGFTAFDKSYFIESQRGDVNKTLKDVMFTAGSYEQSFNDFLIVDDIPKDAGVTFTKDGYNKYIIPYQVAKTLFSSEKGQQFNVYMTKSPGDGKPYVSTVFVKDSDEEAYTEVQMSSATASKGNKYDIVMSAGNVSGDTTYYLSQDSNHRISSKTGVFSAVDIASKFNPGQDIYAYVQNGSKTSEPVKFKLKATNINVSNDSISLIGKDGFKIKAGDNIPLIGGAEISLDGFKFPLGMEVEGNRVRISFGLDVFSTKYEDGEGWENNNPWELFKKSVSSIKDGVGDSTEKLKEYNNLCKKLKGKKFVPEDKSKFNFDVSMLGYAEGYIVGNRIEFTDTCGEIVGKVSFTCTHQGAVAFFPYYVYVKVGGELSVGFGLMRHLPDSNIPFDFGIDLKLTPSLTVGGGVGINGALSVGLYGKGSLPLELNFSKRHGSVDISGEIGIEASIAAFEPGTTLLDGTIHVWDGYWGTQKEASLAKLNAVTDKLREETETTVMSRDYLQYTSDWKGGNIFTRLFSSRAVSEGMEIKDLQTSVYNNSETQLVSLDDGRMMMAWIEDDADRDEYNRLRLMYSVWENGVWSEPKAVSDSGTTDSAPSLATDGKNVYIAWQNVNYKMSQADADPIAKVLEKTEIKFAQYDSEKDEFVNVKTLTDNSSYDYLPTAAAENGECVVYWLSNSGNDLTAKNSNTLYKYSLSSGKTDTVKSDMNNILGIDTIVKGGESEVSYAMDTDGNLATTEDIKAFTLKNGEQVQLSPENEEVKNADFAVAYGKLNGNDTVFFADNSNIYYRENGEVKSIFTSIRSINGDLQVLDNAEETTLMWSEITDAGTDLWVCSYSNGEWNEPVQVTDTGKLLHNISAVYHDGAIRGVLNRTDRLIKDGEYVNGATDLCAMTLSDFTELEAGFVAVDESQFVKGKEADLSVYLKNNGTKDIEKVKITLSDTLSTDITVEETVNLKSGEEKLVTVKYLVPENYGRTDLTVKAVVPGEEEIDEKDNEDTVSVGFADISISNMKVEDVGRFYILTAILSNDNQTTAENVKVEVREGSKDGNVVDTVEVGNLEPGKVKSIQYIVDKTAVDYDGEKLGRIYFVAKVEESGVQSRAAKTEPTEKITEDNFVGAVFEYTAPETEPEPETKPGDINGDGQVTAVDARWVLQIAAGTREVTEAEREIADLNGDGEITAVDARWVLQIAAGTRVA